MRGCYWIPTTDLYCGKFNLHINTSKMLVNKKMLLVPGKKMGKTTKNLRISITTSRMRNFYFQYTVTHFLHTFKQIIFIKQCIEKQLDKMPLI